MVREDIVGGLKNALERGESIEEAKDSFLNANYPEDEIDEALSYLRSYQQEAETPPEANKKKEKLPEQITEIKNIQDLKESEIREVPNPSFQKKKSPYLKYFLIGGGALVLIIALIVILLVTKVINL